MRLPNTPEFAQAIKQLPILQRHAKALWKSGEKMTSFEGMKKLPVTGTHYPAISDQFFLLKLFKSLIENSKREIKKRNSIRKPKIEIRVALDTFCDFSL